MLPLVPIVFVALQAKGPIPHLARGELAVVSQSGGQLGHSSKLVVRIDGSVVFAKSVRGQSAPIRKWKLSKAEFSRLRQAIDRTDFTALHLGARATYPPSAVDGLDRSLAVRQGNAVRGWSNTIWQTPEKPVLLFLFFDDLMNR